MFNSTDNHFLLIENIIEMKYLENIPFSVKMIWLTISCCLMSYFSVDTQLWFGANYTDVNII